MLARFCERLLEQVRARQTSVSESLSSGRCKSYDDYKNMSGQLYGLKQSEQMIKDAYNAMVDVKTASEHHMTDDHQEIY